MKGEAALFYYNNIQYLIMTQSKKASIIVPTLNEEEYIENCLKSLIAQSVKRDTYEIIVSDSSSEDNTVAIAKKYADKVVVCKKVGAGFGRNFGAKEAAAGFLGFIDADTIAGPKWVEGLIEALGKGVMASGPIKTYDATEMKQKLFFKMWNIQTHTSIEFGKPLLPGYNFAVRKEAFEKEGGFFNDNRVSEDIDLSLRLCKHGKAVYSKKMKVNTSSRRFQEIRIRDQIGAGAKFLFLGKHTTWEKWRKKEFSEKNNGKEIEKG